MSDEICAALVTELVAPVLKLIFEWLLQSPTGDRYLHRQRFIIVGDAVSVDALAIAALKDLAQLSTFTYGTYSELLAVLSRPI